MAHREQSWKLALVPAAVIVLAACGSYSPASTQTPSSSTPPVPASASASEGVPTTIPVPTTSAAASTTTPTAITTTTTVAVKACETDGLTAGMGHWARTADGTTYVLSFYNAGSVPCSLQGYPSVAFVNGGNSARVGAAAAHHVTTDPPLVVVAPGGRAEASVTVVDPDAFPATCVVTDVLGFRVYPPGSTAGMAIPHVARTCANPADVTLGVGAVQAP